MAVLFRPAGLAAAALLLLASLDCAASAPRQEAADATTQQKEERWHQVGDTLSRERVVAISMDFSPDGFPAFAYGWNDGERGTRIPVVAWNGESWIEVYHRTSQFPQSYTEFDFKAANNNYYLGLKISESFGSVLNGGREWRGSYAFHNQLFDYQIEEPSGDMIMFWVSDKPSGGGYPGTDNQLVAIRYLAGGWDSYPAGEEAFGEPVEIDSQAPGSNSTGGVSSLRIHKAGKIVVASPDGGEQQVQNYVVAWVNNGVISVATGSLERGFTRQPLPEAAANTINLAVGRVGVGSEYACIAYHPVISSGTASEAEAEVEGEVRVACAAEYGRGQWQRLGGAAIEAAEVVERLAVEIAITTDTGRVFVGGRSALLPSELVVKWAQLPNTENLILPAVVNVTGNVTGESEWTSVGLFGEASISHFELGASGENVYAVTSENFGDGLKVHQLLNEQP